MFLKKPVIVKAGNAEVAEGFLRYYAGRAGLMADGLERNLRGHKIKKKAAARAKCSGFLSVSQTNANIARRTDDVAVQCDQLRLSGNVGQFVFREPSPFCRATV